MRLKCNATGMRNGILISLLSLAIVIPGIPANRGIKASSAAASQLRYLTPVALSFSHDGLELYVVCEDDDSLLAVDVSGQRVLRRVRVGHKPKDVAISPDGRTLYVSNEWSDSVSEIDVDSFSNRRTFKTGWGPIGLTTDRSGKVLYVANSISNDVSLLDLSRGVEIKRLSAGRSPHKVALSRDGGHVYVSNLLPRMGLPDEAPVSELTAIDTQSRAVSERILIPGAIELRDIAEAPSQMGGYLLVPCMRPKNLNPLIQVSQGWFMTHAIAVIRPEPNTMAKQEGKATVVQILLDDIDRYYAGANGAAFTPDGRYAFVTSSEANLVSVIDTASLQTILGQRSPRELQSRLDSSRQVVVRRLPTESDPTAVLMSPDGKTVYIANRLDDSLTVMDVSRLQIMSKIELGGPKQITSLRRGERIFHDASFCFQGQFACATCHPDNHIDGLAWNLETPQLGRDRVLNRTLRGIAETAPYKWNGHNPDLETQGGVRSAKFIFHSEGFNHQQLEDLVAFIKSIPLPPNRNLASNGQLTGEQERGRSIFFKKRCDSCHTAATHYTARKSANVGTATRYDTSGLFDIPQLERIYERAPFLHSGQALSLEEIWTKFNVGDKHGMTSDMTKGQLNDLVEFLKTL